MYARLTAVAGPLKGISFPLTAERLSIGREGTNEICLEDGFVSRRHCLILKDGENFRLKDLGSRNQTAVNGVPLEERRLEHGDEIKIGQSVFLFLYGHSSEGTQTVGLLEEDLTQTDTTLLRPEDALYLDPGKAIAALPSDQRIGRNLQALLEAGEALSSIREFQPLAKRLLEIVCAVIPARRGAILMAFGGSRDFTHRALWHRDPAQASALRVPSGILSRVLRERVSVWSNEVLEGKHIRPTASIVAARIRAVLAVPLVKFDQVIGAIYVDTDDPEVGFAEDHLQLLTGLAGVAAGALETAAYVERLESENRRLQAEVNQAHEIVGASVHMQEVYRFISRVSPTTDPVLITGESGTGKELAARAIHRNSPRAHKRFVSLNCALLPEPLLESELFGHEQGAIAGAVGEKRGKIEEAEGGTVFLDEVGCLTPALQAKLLRVLAESEFERAGGTRSIRSDIRLIAASSHDLKAEVAKSVFRGDLYFRLNESTISLPPLRERSEDLASLVNHFITKYSRKSLRRIMGCSQEAFACLQSYDWPGNVRELENALERAVVLGASERILPDDLPEQIVDAGSTPANPSSNFRDSVRQTKRQIVQKVLDETGGNQTEAARVLGLHPNSLMRLIKTLDLRSSAKA